MTTVGSLRQRKSVCPDTSPFLSGSGRVIYTHCPRSSARTPTHAAPPRRRAHRGAETAPEQPLLGGQVEKGVCGGGHEHFQLLRTNRSQDAGGGQRLRRSQEEPFKNGNSGNGRGQQVIIPAIRLMNSGPEQNHACGGTGSAAKSEAIALTSPFARQLRRCKGNGRGFFSPASYRKARKCCRREACRAGHSADGRFSTWSPP